jgi:phosphatidylserine/phosphatidylglycerophosphate/cardiolipin synthase-like enzyme
MASRDAQFKASMERFSVLVITESKMSTLVNEQIFSRCCKPSAKRRKPLPSRPTSIGGNIANEFADALSKNARKGVSVKALLDWVGSIPRDSDLIKSMQESGVGVVRFRPTSSKGRRQPVLTVRGRKAAGPTSNAATAWRLYADSRRGTDAGQSSMQVDWA